MEKFEFESSWGILFTDFSLLMYEVDKTKNKRQMLGVLVLTENPTSQCNAYFYKHSW
jgi:hypothetical protein